MEGVWVCGGRRARTPNFCLTCRCVVVGVWYSCNRTHFVGHSLVVVFGCCLSFLK